MCLALLNKNNYGYMTPQEFNLFAHQAQLDIFEDLFSKKFRSSTFKNTFCAFAIWISTSLYKVN